MGQGHTLEVLLEKFKFTQSAISYTPVRHHREYSRENIQRAFTRIPTRISRQESRYHHTRIVFTNTIKSLRIMLHSRKGNALIQLFYSLLNHIQIS